MRDTDGVRASVNLTVISRNSYSDTLKKTVHTVDCTFNLSRLKSGQ